jgi:hypothetical protein
VQYAYEQLLLLCICAALRRACSEWSCLKISCMAYPKRKKMNIVANMRGPRDSQYSRT